MSFSVNKGDYIGIVGPNGSGKTTLVKSVLGLIKCDYETIDFNFSDKLRANIGYLPQAASVTDEKFPASVKEIIATGLFSNKTIPFIIDKKDKEKINHIMKLLEIGSLKNKLIGKLSGGQKQRVMLARALINEPEILVLDEPVNTLDPLSRENLYNLLDELNKKRNITILLVTHDIGSIGKYANKILYIDRKIIFYGTFNEFCGSKEMTDYFGNASQHIICHRHDI